MWFQLLLLRRSSYLREKDRDFNKVLLEALDDALISLGESVKHSIYFHLEEKFELHKSEIPNRLKDFKKGLEKIFGVGAYFIEILIMKNLYRKIGKPLEWEEGKKLAFLDYVNAARKTFGQTKTKTVNA
jgi:hypothetical protein